MYFAYPSYFIDFSIFIINYIVFSLFCVIVTVGIFIAFLKTSICIPALLLYSLPLKRTAWLLSKRLALFIFCC